MNVRFLHRISAKENGVVFLSAAVLYTYVLITVSAIHVFPYLDILYIQGGILCLNATLVS